MKTKKPYAWDCNSAYYTTVHKELKIQTRLLEPSFLEWYKNLTPDARKAWVKDSVEYDLQCEADETYKQFIQEGAEKAEKMRETCLWAEKFVHESNYHYLLEDIEAAMGGGKAYNYDRYVSNKHKQIVNEKVEYALDIFRLDEKEISRQSALALTRIINLVNVRNRFERLSELRAPKVIIDDEAAGLMAYIQDIKKGCTTEELEAINDLYDIFLARQEAKDKLNKHELKALERYMPLVRETYETWTSVVNKKNDVYRNLSRAPGSGFSRQ